MGLEIRFHVDTYRVQHIEFLDDLFTLDLARVDARYRIVTREWLDVQWFYSARVDTLTKVLLATMKRAGCIGIYLVVESGCQHVLNFLRKGIGVHHARTTVRAVKDAGIEAFAMFIIGVLGESTEDIRQTIRFALQLRPDYTQFTLCTPYPGKALYAYAEANDLLLTRDWRRFTTLEPVLKVPGVSSKELWGLLKEAYFPFIPGALWKLVKKKFKLVERVVTGITKMVLS